MYPLPITTGIEFCVREQPITASAFSRRSIRHHHHGRLPSPANRRRNWSGAIWTRR